MKRKSLILLPLVACSIGALAGCGGGGAKTKFVISISARSYASEQNMLNLWKREYEARNPLVQVNVSGWGSNEGTSESYIMKNALNRDYLTNIVYTTDDSTANLATKKNFVDLRPYFEADPETDYTKYYSSMLDLTTFFGEFRPTTSYTGSYPAEKSNDAQYGMYFAPREYNMPAILCNVTLFKEHFATEEEKNNWGSDTLRNIWLRLGESSEWTWSTFVKAVQNISKKCEDLNRSGDVGFRAMELNHTWEPVYTTIMKELGGDGLFAVDEHDEVQPNLTSAANKAAYTKIINDFGKNANKYMIDTDYGNQNFSYRTVFGVVVSYPEVGNFYEAFKKVNYELDAINIPCEYVAAGCGGYGILVDKAKQVQKLVTGETATTGELCWDFIKFIISKDGQNLCGREGYIQPVLKELADTGEWLQAYDGKINNRAFATSKELRLDTYCFADPKLRNDLRIAGTTFFRDLFAPTTTSYEDILNKADREFKNILK